MKSQTPITRQKHTLKKICTRTNAATASVRDKRPDCPQVVIALIVTPEGLPLAYEVLAGNTADKTTLKDFLQTIEAQYGKAERIWVMDRGHAACGMLQSIFSLAARRQ